MVWLIKGKQKKLTAAWLMITPGWTTKREYLSIIYHILSHLLTFSACGKNRYLTSYLFLFHSGHLVSGHTQQAQLLQRTASNITEEKEDLTCYSIIYRDSTTLLIIKYSLFIYLFLTLQQEFS